MIEFIALDHILIAVPVGGEAEACHFYGEILGFPRVDKPDSLLKRGGCWFAGPGFGIHVGVALDFTPHEKPHPAFRVADLEATRQHLITAAVPVIPDERISHVRRFYAFDPAGNRLEFIQDGDVF